MRAEPLLTTANPADMFFRRRCTLDQTRCPSLDGALAGIARDELRDRPAEMTFAERDDSVPRTHSRWVPETASLLRSQVVISRPSTLLHRELQGKVTRRARAPG